jgi:hypothetical protein
MQKHSMWWLFLLLFGLTIGSIHSLGWWARPAAAQGPPAQASESRDACAAALRHRNAQPTHWRALLLRQ